MTLPCAACLDVRSDVHPITCMPTSLLCLFPPFLMPIREIGEVPHVDPSPLEEWGPESLPWEGATQTALCPWNEGFGGELNTQQERNPQAFCETGVFTELTNVPLTQSWGPLCTTERSFVTKLMEEVRYLIRTSQGGQGLCWAVNLSTFYLYQVGR